MSQNSGSIPNVSSVFRELVKISSTNPRLNSSKQADDQFRSTTNYIFSNTNGFELNRLNAGLNSGNQNFGGNSFSNNFTAEDKWQTSFPSSIVDNDRQQRHQELMGRLKSSLQQNRQLLGIQKNSPSQRGGSGGQIFSFQRPNGQLSSYNGTNPSMNSQYSQFNHYGTNNQTNAWNIRPESRQKGKNKWAPPMIKYRHIQDVQEKASQSMQNTQNIPKVGRNSTTAANQKSLQNNRNSLKDQFYGQEQRARNNMSSPHSQFSGNNFMTKGQQSQYRRSNQMSQSVEVSAHNQNDHEEQVQQEQDLNKLSIMSQKPSKYNQNLQSYYDICRKPIKPSALTAMDSHRNEDRSLNTSSNNQKFMRKQTPKVEGINLQKAMKILSLDD